MTYVDLHLQVAHPRQLVNSAMIVFSPIDGVTGQLQPIRSSDFVEDPKQIVTDGVFTQIELVGNVTIGETFGHQVHNAFFPLCQQTRSFPTKRFSWQSRAQGIDHEVQFLAGSPHLPPVYCVDALAQHLSRLLPREYAAGSCPECFDDHRRLARIEYYDDTGPKVRSSYLSRHIDTSQGIFFETGTDHCNVGFALVESIANSNRVNRVPYNPGPIAGSSQRCRY